ncbi:hypothetical protein ACEE21_15195 [Clostridium baratii]
MEIKVDNVISSYGTGKVDKLTKSQLSCLQSVCKTFREVLVDNCMSHALYRCNLSSRDNIIYLVISGTDANGNMKELQVGLNLDTQEVYTFRIELDNRALIGKELYNMIVKLMETVPFSVGMLDIPLEGRFEEGVITGYNKEPGTVLFVVKDSLDNSFFTEF